MICVCVLYPFPFLLAVLFATVPAFSPMRSGLTSDCKSDRLYQRRVLLSLRPRSPSRDRAIRDATCHQPISSISASSRTINTPHHFPTSHFHSPISPTFHSTQGSRESPCESAPSPLPIARVKRNAKGQRATQKRSRSIPARLPVAVTRGRPRSALKAAAFPPTSTDERDSGRLGLLAPLVLFPDLRLLLRGEVVDDVERLADLLRRLALDHAGHLGARQVQ